MSVPSPPQVRCAIYTRKSSAEGLDQPFNSLQAQREAAEAYIKSQAAEGWRALPGAYDDGGVSGGTMDRPGLRRLLGDIAKGAVDVVVVYKIDRLTRSLGDFAKIVEAFDAKGVSFVSVTQAFNTTTSMGRLTLNVLLSFAQFEREVTGERIRDKIAASKAKGMWMGGSLPLGYDGPKDLVSRALVVNHAEAATVRAIFDRYLEVGSVHRLQRQLEDDGVRSKVLISRAGRTRGGVVLGRGALFHLLQNRVYLGDLCHLKLSYPGAHPAIVDRDIFDAVQKQLADNRVRRATNPSAASNAPLTGKLLDTAGRVYSPTHATGRGGRYRYYVLAEIQQGRQTDVESAALRRLPAAPLERHALGVLRRLSGDPKAAWPGLLQMLEATEVRSEETRWRLRTSALFGDSPPELAIEDLRRRLESDERLGLSNGGASVTIVTPGRLQFRGGRTWGADARAEGGRETILARSLRAAIRLSDRMGLSPEAPRRGAKTPRNPHHRRLCRLAYLAPDIQAAIIAGRHPQSLTVAALTDLAFPACWADQRARLGFGDHVLRGPA